MGDLAEDRVHDRTAGKQLVFVASGMGVTVVETSGDSIGRFRLVRECTPRDLAGADGWLAAATGSDVLACRVDEDGDGEWVATGFGPAVAVGFDDGDLLAAAPDGTLGRVVDVADDPADWLEVAAVDGAVRAVDGPLVGADDGVYQLTPDGIVDVGLEDVRDVSAGGAPLAATGDGLFRLGNGWLRELDGPVDLVAGTGRPAGDDGETADGQGSADPGGTGSEDPLASGFAAAGEGLYQYRADPVSVDVNAGPADEVVDPAVAARAWRERPVPFAPVVGVAFGERTYALAADGTLLLDRGEDWTHQALGLPDPVALATPG